MSAMGTYGVTGSAGMVETWGLVERLVSLPEWWLSEWLLVSWPLALLTVLSLAVAVLAGLLARGWWRAREAALAEWWEIIPPRTLPPGAAVSVWRLLAGVLAGTRRGRVSLLFCADADKGSGLHAYLAASAATDPQQVARGIASLLPGADVKPCPALRRPPGVVAARELVPKDGPSAPVLNHSAHRSGDAAGEPLRAVLDGLVEVAEAGGFAAVQVVVSRSRGRDGRSLGETVGAQVQASVRFAEGVCAELWTGSVPNRADTARDAAAVEDPSAVERRREVEAKRVGGPHLRATVRLVVAGPRRRRAAARRAKGLTRLLTGLVLDPTAVTTRRVRHAIEVVATFRHGRAFVASVRELAAVWHLPADPTQYGFPASRAGRRAPGCDLPHLDNPRHPRGWRRRDHLRPVTDQTREDDHADDQHDDDGNDDGYGGNDDAA